MKNAILHTILICPILFAFIYLNNKYLNKSSHMEKVGGVFVYSNNADMQPDACLIATDGKACMQLENYCIYIEDDNLVLQNLNGEKRVIQCTKQE